VVGYGWTRVPVMVHGFVFRFPEIDQHFIIII